MADDDIFGGDEFFNSDDFEEFGDLGDDTGDDLEAMPDFSDLGGAELGLASGDDELLDMEFEEEEPGISRTFKLLIGAGIVIIFIIVILVILFAVLSGDDLSAGEKTSTAVVLTNTAIADAHYSTLTAIALIDEATQTAVVQSEKTATAAYFDSLTQEAQMILDANASATAQAQVVATSAAQTAVAEDAAFADLTATAETGRVYGQAIREGLPLSGATIRLYRDDGDGEFNPGGQTPTPTDDPGSTDTGSDAGSGGTAQMITYLEQVTGSLASGAAVEWTFSGTTGDSAIISAVANDTTMDLFLRLIDPLGTELAGDDDSGGNKNPTITLDLSVTGLYTIEVKSVTGAGDYMLSLSRGLSVPGTDPQDAEPTEESSETGVNIDTGKTDLVLARAEVPSGANNVLRQDPTPTPDSVIDQLINTLIIGENGDFDFGSMDPGIYWLEIDYDTLTPELQALIPSTSMLVFKISVPTGGEFTIEVVDLTPTPTPIVDPDVIGPIQMTETAFAILNATISSPAPTLEPGTSGIVTLTPTDEPEMPDTGIFDEIGDGNSDLNGTGGLTVLAIAAAGLIAVVFIARKLRSSN